MSETPVAPVAQAQAPAAAPKLNAIQLAEQALFEYIQQREKAIANVHAIEGAIQAAQQLIGKLKAAEAEAVAAAKKLASEAVSAVEKVESGVKSEVAAIENKVVSIESAAKKTV